MESFKKVATDDLIRMNKNINKEYLIYKFLIRKLFALILQYNGVPLLDSYKFVCI